MDFFDQRVLAALKDGRPRSFAEILGQVGFSHNTLQRHLSGLIVEGLVLREKATLNSFGRPKFAYRVQPKTTKQVTATLEDPLAELVTINFSRLKHACRFEKGGYCKETRKNCTPQICPQIRK